MNLLVLRYRFIGDTILTVPFLRNLRRAHPDARIDLVAAPYSSDVLRGMPYVDGIIVYDPPTKHADSGGRHRTLGSKIRFVAELRKNRYDKAYVLKRSFSSAVIALLSGAPERIGFDTEARGFLLTKRVPYRKDQHEVRNFLDVLRADGVPVVDDHLEAWLSAEETAFADDFLARGGCAAGTRLVGIHPFTADPARAWHEDNFIAAANALQEEHGARLLLFGGKKDLELAAVMGDRIRPGPVSAVGCTDLRQTMALLSKCSLLLCNDSGIMHLGAALDVPLVALFGPQTPDLFGPWGRRCRVLSKRFRCSPCKQKFFTECEPSPRGKPMCMEAISVDEVIAAASDMLSGRPG
ncbi:MAG: ADP-heptose--lipopolysaccharide heptosyltransferase [Deltaproteobacteria bacterium]|nr:ADP-heptose--lipopolysaccharide heptosyltransferase [Deltaproteobacteria bacterium]